MFPRRGIIALVTTALALVLLFTFKTPASPVVGSTDGSGSTSGSTAIAEATPTPTDSTTSGGATATPDPTTPAAAAVTVTGSTVQSGYGEVAVQITIDRGKITDVQAIALPTGRHSGQISSYSGPILASEVLQAQSAKIDIVSGATYTTEAYAESVQSAIDQAAQNGIVITS